MLREDFAACEAVFPGQQAQLRRLSLALCRGGVEQMDELCRIYANTPVRLIEIRSIGIKSLLLIEAVCRQYQNTGLMEE